MEAPISALFCPICHTRPVCNSGLAFKIILFFLDKVASTTSETNVASLRFRSVTDNAAPAVVVNARCPNGFLKIPAALKPLVQGVSTTVRCVQLQLAS